MLGVEGIELDPVDAAREQVDHRCAAEAELGCLELVLECSLRPVQQDEQLALLGGAAAERIAQLGQREEQVALGQREIFLHQPVGREAATGRGQHRLQIPEPDLPDRAGRGVLQPGLGVQCAHPDRDAIGEHLLVDA